MDQLGLHLDRQYRDRFQEYVLFDGKTINSRDTNWRSVEWEKVIKIVTRIRDATHEVLCNGSSFVSFMNFRWAGQHAVYNSNGKFEGYRPIRTWTVGWTDGTKCYLKDIDFKTGNLLKEYVAPLKGFKAHIHPRVQNKVLGSNKLIWEVR